MRVLHFYKTFFPDSNGGVEQVINQIAIGANSYGVQTEVLSLTSQKDLNSIPFNGYTIHRAKQNLVLASTGLSLSAFRRFSQLALKADIVHYHFPWPFMDIVHFATNIKKPTILTYHSDIIKQQQLLKLYRPLMHHFLSSVDKVVATSSNYLESSEVLAKYKHKVSVIPIGIDKLSYPSSEPAKIDFWREKFGEKFFLFIGVLRYYKGLHILIEAASGSDYPIVIVGKGPIEEQLKAQVVKLGLSNIVFLGHVSDEDKVSLLAGCFAVLFPSHLRSEAFGVSLLEGAMFGKPMISTEIGTGTSYINVLNLTGLVVPPSNPIALRQAMQYLWNNPEEAYRMGVFAEQRYRQYFMADKMVKSYVELYLELLN
jgi:glycosyltransferase involved in cell wall biosynthesis